MTKISQLSSIGDSLAVDDQFLIRDVDDGTTPNKSVTVSGITRALPLGSATAPALAFASDKNTGLYSPGADQLAISTNGTGRLFVDASGQVGVNANTLENQRLRIATGVAGGATPPTGIVNNLLLEGGSTASMMFDGTNASTQSIYFRDADTASASFRGALRYTHSDDSFQIFTNGTTERLRIDSSGRLGLGTSSPQRLLTLTSDGSIHQIAFNDSDLGASGAWWLTGNVNGVYKITQSTNAVGSLTSLEDRLVIDSSGRVGIGTTSPASTLHVAGITTAYGNGGASLRWGDTTTLGTLTYSGSDPIIQTNTGNILFWQGTTERARIDSSGRLLIGTSTSRANGGQTAQIQLEAITANGSSIALTQNQADTNSAILLFGKTRSTSIGGSDLVSNGDRLGEIRFSGGDGTSLTSSGAAIASFVDGTPGLNDMPGRLVFSTTADGASSPTERMRIDSSGNVSIGLAAGGDRTLTIRSAGATRGVFSTDAVNGILNIGCTNDSTIGNIVFNTGASISETARITTDKYLRMASGTGGIQFGGDTAAANALDDYEEGTWTPAYGLGGGSVTYSLQQGEYVKVGNTVTARGWILLSAISSPTGNTAITGLPFTSGNRAANVSSGTIGIARNFASADLPLMIYNLSNSASIIITKNATNVGAAQLQGSDLTATTAFYFAVTYAV